MSEFDVHAGSEPADGAAPASRPVSAGADDADAYEQHRDVMDADEDDMTEVPDDVDPADAYEQHRTVGGDDDEYGPD